MITVNINFNKFIDYPPYLSLYLTAIELLEHGIPLEISLTDILKQPKLMYGKLTTYEDFINKSILYVWETSNER